jgi:choline-sulfatase
MRSCRNIWNRYREDEIDLPKLATSPNQDDPHWQRLRRVSDMDSYDITEAHIRAARRAYYGAISYVDDQLGSLVKTLGDCGLEGETITLFTADHGDMLGERGLWYKMNWHENAARVPLIIGFPGEGRPRRVAQSVSTIDLLPTLAEVAGDGAAPDYAAPVDGRSLLPHIAGSGGHDEVLGEYFGEGAIAPLLMIRRGKYKYIRSRPDPEQLYDLAADPLEQVDLAGDAAHAQRLADFRAEALARWDEDAPRAGDRQPAPPPSGGRVPAARQTQRLGPSAPDRRLAQPTCARTSSSTIWSTARAPPMSARRRRIET